MYKINYCTYTYLIKMKNVKNLHTPSHIKGLIKIQFRTFQKYFNNDIQILLLLTLLYISSKCDKS